MMIGFSQVLTCPFCGTKKDVMSLMSGNNIGAQLWSDNKEYAPMCPETSWVQKCPHCGKYYFRSRQKFVHSDSTMSCDCGELSLQEVKEALEQLTKEGFENNSEEVMIRLLLFHTYNDEYFRYEDKPKTIPAKEDHALFVECGLWLIDHHVEDVVLKAEYYREIGEKEKAKSILEAIEMRDDFHTEFAKKIMERIDKDDTQVFLVY